MSSRKNKELFEAICFFSKKNVLKEMRYSEFEAVLDGVVGIPELANKSVKAAYIKINHLLTVHSMVTFCIEFDGRGFADEDWNIPLRHLAENAGPGPDLGAGPVRLACRSQCSVSWYQRELWEPNQDSINHFVLVRDAVKRNKLGLIVDQSISVDIPVLKVTPDELVSVPVVSDEVGVSKVSKQSASDSHARLEAQAKEYQSQVDKLVQRQKQTLHILDEKYKDEIDQVKRAMRNETQSYRHQAQALEQQVNQNKVLLDKIQARNAQLERDYGDLESQLETQKSQYVKLKDEYLGLLRNQRSAVDTGQITELKDQLTLKAVEADELKENYLQQMSLANELKAKLELLEQQKPLVNSNSDELVELNSLLSSKQLEIASLSSKVTELETAQHSLNDRLASEKAKFDHERDQLSTLKGESDSLNEQAKSAEFRLQEANQTLATLYRQLEIMKQELSDRDAGDATSEQLVDKMEKQELVFVAYHPGAGHISLPARQLEDYLEKPLAFAAQKCGVTLSQYKSWLLHYESTECLECQIPVKRIDTPSEFKAGIDDHCSKHRINHDNITMFRQTS